MSEDIHSQRKKISFSQAEGVKPMPRQLQLKEISEELRAQLWYVVHRSIQDSIEYSSMGGRYIVSPWKSILFRKHVFVDHGMADEFDDDTDSLVANVKAIFTDGDYCEVFEFVQWLLRQPEEAIEPEDIDLVLKRSRAAYRLLEDNCTIVPISSEQEIQTINAAFADLAHEEFDGARAHLRFAAQHLSVGKPADSIRESIHAVESVARTLGGTDSLSGALQRLKNKSALHPDLEKGFRSIYGFTSDEKGIRHPLLDDGTSKVDEIDAIFMIGACASFVSYLINRTRDIK